MDYCLQIKAFNQSINHFFNHSCCQSVHVAHLFIAVIHPYNGVTSGNMRGISSQIYCVKNMQYEYNISVVKSGNSIVMSQLKCLSSSKMSMEIYANIFTNAFKELPSGYIYMYTASKMMIFKVCIKLLS